MLLSGIRGRVIDLSSIQGKEQFTLVKQIQRQLLNAGYLTDESDIDGIVGKRTLQAFARFKKDNYLGFPYMLGETAAQELLKYQQRSNFFKPTGGIGWISSRFGMRTLNNRTRMHNGIDIAANRGTRVYSAVNGTISQVTTSCVEGNLTCGAGWGNFVKIKADNLPYEFVYAHLDKVAYGLDLHDRVKRGQMIGFVGNTGYSFGDHLHFEVRHQGKPVDPLSAMRVV
jgi:murein DD-endopeptidase MepM/ murein hydrolase activator NlpD